jgi:hypothetical protein
MSLSKVHPCSDGMRRFQAEAISLRFHPEIDFQKGKRLWLQERLVAMVRGG